MTPFLTHSEQWPIFCDTCTPVMFPMPRIMSFDKKGKQNAYLLNYQTLLTLWRAILCFNSSTVDGSTGSCGRFTCFFSSLCSISRSVFCLASIARYFSWLMATRVEWRFVVRSEMAASVAGSDLNSSSFLAALCNFISLSVMSRTKLCHNKSFHYCHSVVPAKWWKN